MTVKNLNLNKEIEKYLELVIIVEGSKDGRALKALGFEKVFLIHKTGKGIRERVEEIVEEVGRAERLCILTDFDDAGRKLNREIKRILQELGVRVDNRLRGVLRREGVSHVEGLKADYRQSN